MLKVKRLSPAATLPKYASLGAACFDISAAIAEPVCVVPGEAIVVPTGLAVEVKEGFALMLYSRSGHGFKNNVRLSNCVGVIDSDYRGEIMASIYNDGHSQFEIQPGDRILQGFVVSAQQIDIEEVSELGETLRGTGGFGSTGTGELFSKESVDTAE